MENDAASDRQGKGAKSAQDFSIPELTAPLRQRIASSPVDEFVAAHGAADVFRELVQNEFDAYGSEIGIRITDTQLEVTGTGRTISPRGWARLSVLIGTGEVLGDPSGEVITAKESSIGSKNLGMRSLFHFGDRIHVRSDGQMAVLDFRNFGTARQADPVSKGRKGVLIQVPLRTEQLRRFEPFTHEREEEALADIERVLFPTLVKLAMPGRRRGIEGLEITSERLRRSLRWRQDAENQRSKVSGVSVTRRRGRLKSVSPDAKSSRREYEELEFSRFVDLPPEFQSLDFPAYYRSPGRVRIAVSMALRSGKPISSQLGHHYYPLQASLARTGCALSVSAPFQLDGERTRPIPSPWNTWLNGQAADLVADLVGADWFGRFGKSAFELVLPQGSEEQTFAHVILARLKKNDCWPASDGLPAAATTLVIPSHDALRGHLSAKDYLHPDLVDDDNLAKLALSCGAKRFTLNSLVYLRCGGKKTTGLRTALAADESSCFYDPYPGEALDPDEQHRTAAALTILQRQLTSQNRGDLRETPTTLSATGKLAPAHSLVRVEPEMWNACPERLETRLHQRLYDDMAIARHCRPFELARWIEQVAEKAAAGTVAEDEHEALYLHLLAPAAKLTSRLVGVLRKSPVVRDDHGGWARPDSLALLPPKDATLLGRVVRSPDALWRQRPDILRRLAIRRKVIANDLVTMAQAVEQDPELAEPFEDLLRRQLPLLTPKVAAALAGIAFLRNRSGRLAAPARLYFPTPLNLNCLQDSELLSEDKAVYRRLGCQTLPTSAVLLEVIDRARNADEPPPAIGQLYPALVAALKAEREPAVPLAHRPILYVKGRFVSPHETVVALRLPRCLQMALPVLKSGGPLADAYLALGAHALPKTYHWVSFFQWIDRRAREFQGKVGAFEQSLLREAYKSRGSFGLPDLPRTALCLLSIKGTVHSLDDLLAGRFLEDDYPELAEALIAAKAEVSFADTDEWSRIFFRSLGIQLLSNKCGEGRVVVGAPAVPPSWFQAKAASKALEQLHREDFAQGLAELAYALQAQSNEFQPLRMGLIRRRLQAIRKIAFSTDLQRNYQVGKRVSVAADAAIEGDALYLRPPRYRSEYDHILALELARLVGATRLADVRALASSVLPLLQAERPAEVLAYLRRLGIRPATWGHQNTDADSEADPAELTREQITQSLVASVHISPPSLAIQPAPAPIPSPTRTSPPVGPVPPAPLPALDEVKLSVSVSEGKAPLPWHGSSGVAGRNGSVWAPRTLSEIERDREVGLRGEALVYRAELERVRTLGYENPEEHVVWVSKDEPGADHDIRSIGVDGGTIWIEVKSTTGSDGRFEWSIAEFEKALREGPRYELWRVYGAGSTTPHAKFFQNPASLLRGPVLRLELGTLRAFVESR
ncbi:DUF3883 domain-containing protein [Mesorhizobium sp. WSM4310]|uniref:DUF3883 domain-containing protein n=1 Tax=Mesorhizobium sp. WSM4310 TaxID=2589883 RepID=UPI00115EFE15|nr:DUF3883 domain-containing protein [Mesorhizobium sp. WSM4310]TRC89688.1 DUF3883 domain-containing protein [Mesorhizobium sp. WSM4310]